MSGDEIYRYPGEGDGAVLPIVTDLLKNGYDSTFSIEPHMAVVFHDNSVQASDKIRFDNFVTYGRKFETLLEKSHRTSKAPLKMDRRHPCRPVCQQGMQAIQRVIMPGERPVHDNSY